jgi:hypothetical protein
MKMKQYKQCQGCLSLIEKLCDQQEYIYTNCPCSKCLIKSVCDEACFKFAELDLQSYLRSENGL